VRKGSLTLLALPLALAGCASIWMPPRHLKTPQAEVWNTRPEVQVGQVVQMRQNGVYAFVHCFADCPTPTIKVVDRGVTPSPVPTAQLAPLRSNDENLVHLNVMDDASVAAAVDALAQRLPKSGGSMTFVRRYAVTEKLLGRERAVLVALLKRGVYLGVVFTGQVGKGRLNLVLELPLLGEVSGL
jgi:hypothetical protein